jgi:hypothetical protein
MASICSSESSSAAPKTPYPALLMATSMRPKSQRRGVADVEHLGAERSGVRFGDVFDRFWFARRTWCATIARRS